MSKTLSFTVVEDGDLKYPTQEKEERCMTTIDFKFYQGLKNSATMFQQTIMINPIDGPARSSIGTSSTTTQSFRLAFSEIRTTKSEESA
jgi:hypothetical protein